MRKKKPGQGDKLPIQNRTRTVYRRVNKEAGQTQPGYLRVYDPGPPLGNFTKAMAKTKPSRLPEGLIQPLLRSQSVASARMPFGRDPAEQSYCSNQPPYM
jgi:hypothetical protein